jgi:hypothetical protein
MVNVERVQLIRALCRRDQLQTGAIYELDVIVSDAIVVWATRLDSEPELFERLRRPIEVAHC